MFGLEPVFWGHPCILLIYRRNDKSAVSLPVASLKNCLKHQPRSKQSGLSSSNTSLPFDVQTEEFDALWIDYEFIQGIATRSTMVCVLSIEAGPCHMSNFWSFVVDFVQGRFGLSILNHSCLHHQSRGWRIRLLLFWFAEWDPTITS